MSLQDKLAELRVKNNMNDRYLKDAIASHAHIANGIIAEIDAIEKQIADAEVTYSTGDRFTFCGDKYILVYMGGDKIGLSNLKTGGCYKTDGHANNKTLITQAQFRDLCVDRTYKRYWDNRKQQKVSE